MSEAELATAGIDVGTSAVKTALVRTAADDVGARVDVLALRADRIRRRDLRAVIRESWDAALDEAGLSAADVVYVAMPMGQQNSISKRTPTSMSRTSASTVISPSIHACILPGVTRTRISYHRLETKSEKSQVSFSEAS